MRGGSLLLSIALATGLVLTSPAVAETSLEQAASISANDPVSPYQGAVRGVGVNIFEPLNPQPPTETVTNTPSPYSAADPYAGQGHDLGPFILVPVITAATFFTQDLYDEAKKDGWIVISMKTDWKRIFPFQSAP